MGQVSFFPPPPYQTAISDNNGIMTPAWQKWFQQLYARNGGAVAIPNVKISNNSTPIINLAVGSINTTIYTSPTGLSTVIDSFSVTNSDNIAHTISMFIVPATGVPTTANQVVINLSIPANSTSNVGDIVSQIIGSGGMVVAVSDTANVLRAYATGRQVS